ncbi:MAG: VRR-NUC domain-containing protein [Ignavibacteria bacterium]|jgi:hypothetical protein|nr:VRR-NUC domain-containing protein [Ignavibacteria bacterium]MCU7525846.1 VRR-NUC domain-containing protein [Ignavibacteria bacterium]
MLEKLELGKLEKDIEKKFVKAVENAGGIAPKFISPGTSGMPDRLAIFPGGFIFPVETKKPKGGRLSARQRLMHKKLKDLDVRVWLVCTEQLIQEFMAYVESVRNGHQV